MRAKWMSIALLLLICAGGLGCARAARDTSGFAVENSATVQAPFEQTWQTVKQVLREQEFNVYTRDKRGRFVAYSEMKRRFFVPERVQHTIELETVSDNETSIYIETIKQVYGVTLLTYPGWHDRKTTDASEAAGIIEAVQARVSGEPMLPNESQESGSGQ